MIDSVFGGLFSLLTLVFVLGLVIFMFLAIRNRNHIPKWGRLIGLFILAGTAISGFAAIRDAYATVDALFSLQVLTIKVSRLVMVL